MNTNFVHLHCHDEYSILDGFGKPQHYIEKAKKLGMTHLAITNHGNADGAIKFQNICKENGIIPIIGAELYIVENIEKKIKVEKRKHITILVKNEIGWKNLLKMISISNLRGHFYKPRIDKNILLENIDGLVLMTACTSSFLTCEWGHNLFVDLFEKIHDDLYLEIMPHQYEEQRKLNILCSGISKDTGIKLVATNDCHYVNQGDAKAHEVLLAVQSKAKWTDKKRWRFSVDGLFLKTKKEMLQTFRRQQCLDFPIYKTALENTMEIAKKCEDFSIKKLTVDLPQVNKNNISDEKFLIELCEKGFENKLKNKAPNEQIYRKRLKEELEIIKTQNFARYFLIVWELIDWCNQNNIMVGPGRGSSGGSLVSYLLNITAVDPIKHKLLFARFISPTRTDLPDIDIDFEDTKRHLIRHHLEEIYGADSICGVSTFSQMKGKGAIRDVSRVFDIPLAEVNKVAECIITKLDGDQRSNCTIEDAFNDFEDGKKFKKKYPEVSEIAMKLEGQIRGKGQHAAAICISNDNLRDGQRVALIRGKDKEKTTNFDKLDIEHVGLMKLDILGLNTLTILNYTNQLIEKEGKRVDFKNLNLEDKKVLKQFSDGNCVGVFQFGTYGLMNLCKNMGINSFIDIVHATSLYRPGALKQKDLINDFIARKNGKVNVEYIHPVLEKITKDTNGVLLFQEQIMQLVCELSGFSWEQADNIRKIIGKSRGAEQFKTYKQKFIDGCKENNTLDVTTAGELWEELSGFGSYGFNLSHAVEYSMISYWCMYCKVYYPVEFLCANLTYGNDDDRKNQIIEEALRLNTDIRAPKVGISDSHKLVVKNNVLYMPFISIKGVGEKTASNFLNINQKGFYISDKKKISQKFLNILKEIDAYNDVPLTDDFAEFLYNNNFLQYNLCKDLSRSFKAILEKLNIKLGKISDDNGNKNVYFGQVIDIKYNYNTDKKSYSSAYCRLKVNNEIIIHKFGKHDYETRKDEIEHCADQFILTLAYKKNNTLQSEKVWLQTDILSGNLRGLKLNILNKARFNNAGILDCKDCELRNECKHPVEPSKGLYNILIVGEAPGKDEDKQRVGFVGKAGKLLWDTIEDIGYKRRQFHITNVVKCYPSKTKTPDKKHIRKCSKWIEEEIKEIKPVLILAFGNTSLKFFNDENSGITGKNGTTEWNEKYNAWINWCIHPAAILYHRENLELFKNGIKNFANKIKIFGNI